MEEYSRFSQNSHLINSQYKINGRNLSKYGCKILIECFTVLKDCKPLRQLLTTVRLLHVLLHHITS